MSTKVPFFCRESLCNSASPLCLVSNIKWMFWFDLVVYLATEALSANKYIWVSHPSHLSPFCYGPRCWQFYNKLTWCKVSLFERWYQTYQRFLLYEHVFVKIVLSKVHLFFKKLQCYSPVYAAYLNKVDDWKVVVWTFHVIMNTKFMFSDGQFWIHVKFTIFS